MSIFSKHYDKEEALSRLAQRVEQRNSKAQDLSPTFETYLKLAALCYSFDPAGQLADGDDNPVAAEILLNQSQPIGQSGARWQLNDRAREWGLSLIRDAREVLSLLEKNKTLLSRSQTKAFEDYLNGTRAPLHEQSIDELRASRYAVTRLTQIAEPPPLPSVLEINSRIQELQTFESLQNLTAAGVVDRLEELDTLRRYVGVLDASSLRTVTVGSARRRIRGVFSGNRQPPLLMHGPGGIGKSTILAAFVQEHALSANDFRFPFSYLDFERASISPRDPVSIIREITRQLAFQYPDAPEAIETLEREIELQQRQSTVSFEADQLISKMEYIEDQLVVERGRFQKARNIIEVLARTVTSLVQREASLTSDETKNQDTDDVDRPFLIILDSFEEAQQRSIDAVEQLWGLFAHLQDQYRLLRVVVSGRAPVEKTWKSRAKPEVMKVKELDSHYRVQLLRRQGMPEKVAELIGAKLSGNPLTLHLAVSLFKKRQDKDPDAKWLQDLETGGWRQLFIDADAFIQGQLYDRILEHVARDDVRQLAHPGLVLRRITVPIIQHVLAQPCGLGEINQETAQSLFDGLASEVDLVEKRGSDDTLYHRPDVRELMLKLMQKDKSELIGEIERLAVDYYSTDPTPEFRAEEIYHRLRLGEHPREVDKLWMAGVSRFLDDALDEVPLKAQAFLASKLDGMRSIDQDVFKAADLADWEALIADRAEHLMVQGQWKDALNMVRERKDRSPDSVLFPIEATALLNLGKPSAAKTIVDKGLEATMNQGNQSVRLALLKLAAEIALEQDDFQDACDYLESAGHLVGGLNMPMRQVEILVDLIELIDRQHLHNRDIRKIKQKLIDVVRPIEEDQFSGRDDLSMRIALAVGVDDSDILRKMLRIHSSEMVSKSVALDFGNSLFDMTGKDHGFYRKIVNLTYNEGYSLPKNDPDNLSHVVIEMSEDGKLGHFLDELVADEQLRPDVRKSVVEHFFVNTTTVNKS